MKTNCDICSSNRDAARICKEDPVTRKDNYRDPLFTDPELRAWLNAQALEIASRYEIPLLLLAAKDKHEPVPQARAELARRLRTYIRQRLPKGRMDLVRLPEHPPDGHVPRPDPAYALVDDDGEILYETPNTGPNHKPAQPLSLPRMARLLGYSHHTASLYALTKIPLEEDVAL